MIEALAAVLIAAAGAEEAAVASTVAQFYAALAAGESRAVLALLADDALIVEAGVVETLAEYRKHHLAEDIEFARAVPTTRDKPRVVVQGDVAWAVGKSTTRGTFKEKTVDSLGADLIILTRASTGWRIRAVHWSSRRRTAP